MSDINITIEDTPIDVDINAAASIDTTNINVDSTQCPVQSVNGKIGFVTLTYGDIGFPSGLATSGDLNNYYLKSNPSGFITNANVVYTTGTQTINGEKNFTSLKRSNITVSVIPTLKNIFDTNYPTTFWDYDTLQLPAERNVIYYIPTSWDPPKTRNIRLPRTGNFAGDSLIVSTNYMPPSSAINFYSYDPGPGWVLIDTWSNASFDGLYRPFNLSMITYQDSNPFTTPWTKQANRWNVTPPASINSGGTPGDLSFDGTNIYVCVGQNNWRRLSASTWS